MYEEQLLHMVPPGTSEEGERRIAKKKYNNNNKIGRMIFESLKKSLTCEWFGDRIQIKDYELVIKPPFR